MKGHKMLITFGLIALLTFWAKHTFSIKAPFNRGINLTNWFQVDSPQKIPFTKYTRTDFEQIKSLGCDAVRLPINLHFMTNGDPDYIIDPLFFTFLDQVVGWCEELEIHLILDNHTFDVTKDTDPNIGTILEKVWHQMATRYHTTSTLIYYEVLNEPHGIADITWNSIQQKVVTAIREIDTKHTIVVGPANWNSYNNLEAMPTYSDTNLIYTFHFYDPFLFTHQGASWTILGPAKNIPFPFSAEEMPTIPLELTGTWGESSYNDYKNVGNEAKVREWIDIAASFSESRNVPVWCGEFGVYDANCPYDDRSYWYGVVRKHLEESQISWTIWDYQGAFGVFNKGSNEMFEHDLNIQLLSELGLNTPEQTPFIPSPDSLGFSIYNDYFGENIKEGSYGSGTFNYYETDAPQSGNYCYSWKGGKRYDALALYFNPNRDFSHLAQNGYAITLMIKGNDTNGKFDLRFIDSDTDDPSDHPWRIKRTIDKNTVNWDNKWHKLYLPLSSFIEQGSWDSDEGAWYNPEGKFDWTAVERFEIAAEYADMNSSFLVVDNISLTNKDTLDSGEPTEKNNFSSPHNFAMIQVFAVNKQVEIENSSQSGAVQYWLVDVTGRSWCKGSFEKKITINAEHFPAGIYMLYLQKRDKGTMVKKILLN